MKKNKDIRSPEENNLIKTWIRSVILIFMLFLTISGFDILAGGENEVLYFWLTFAGGGSIVAFCLWVYLFAKRLGNIALYVAIVTQIFSLLIIIETPDKVYRYFFLMLSIVGLFSLIKIFKQLAILVLFGFIFNIAVLIFVLPYFGWDSLVFSVMFLLATFISLLILVQTYNVSAKESRSDKALDAFSSLLNCTPNYMVITDSQNKVRYISKPLAKFAHFSSQDIAVGKPLLDLFADISLKLMFAEVLDTDSFVEKVISIDISGEKRHFKVMADKLHGDNGGLFIDITDITQMVNSQQEAEIANRAKSSFLATMSHEIRTPMNAILGIAQIQLHKRNLSDEQSTALEKIYNSSNTLLGIINDILDMSKIETGKMELSLVNYDVPSFIHDTMQLNIVRVGSKEIEVKLDIAHDLPSRMLGDELRLRQILTNILSNAIKYTERGYVKLSIEAVANDNSPLSDNIVPGDDILLRFIVEDTGQGMKPEDVERLFMQYTRFNIETNRSTEGTGIGLNITSKLVELMDGTIEVWSEFGKGSKFTVMVKQKAVECEPIGMEMAERLCDFSFTGEKQLSIFQIKRELMPYGKVLIVDDVETNLYVAEGLLSPYELKIETSLSGYTAIEKVKNGKVYDIIFMDHMMPKMDGIETTHILREMGYNGTIVALTANALVGNREMFQQNGFDDFIAKPIDVRELNTALKKYIRDKYPEEAMKYKASFAEASDVQASDTLAVKNPRLIEVFCKDAENAILTLRETIKNGDIKLFKTTSHAMKSALHNIGETEKAKLAGVLEDAGNRGDIEFISTNTEIFLEVLEALIQANKPDEVVVENENISEDTEFLREQLLIIKTACDDYDDELVYNAIDTLKSKPLKPETSTVLEKIRDTIYFDSNFDMAAEQVETFLVCLEK